MIKRLTLALLTLTLTACPDGRSISIAVEAKDGIDGQDGANGQDGLDGRDGTDGVDGLSAYELWLESGETGSAQDFLDSLIGPKGIDGLNGQDGAQGIQGLPGQVLTVQTSNSKAVRLCSNDSATYQEYGLIVDGELYAVYHQLLYNGNGNARVVIGSNTFWARLQPGVTYVTTNGSSCQFTYTKLGNIITISSNGNVETH
jgi:hypothetical protein